MSVNARLALAMLALGHDLRHAPLLPVPMARRVPAPQPEDTASVIASLAPAWIEGTDPDRPPADPPLARRAGWEEAVSCQAAPGDAPTR